MVSIGWKWIVGIAITLALVVAICIAAAVAYYFYRRWKNKRLGTPVGELSIVSGPYAERNAVPPTAPAPHIAVALFKSQDVYGRYGYQVVKKNDQNVVDEEYTSSIRYNSTIYTVFKESTPPVGFGGFKFRIPTQKGGLAGTDICYRLVGTFYSNSEGTGKPLYKDIFMGILQSEVVGLVIEEYETSVLGNKLLTAI